VRTPYSEQYALYHPNQLDDEGRPLSLGKLDLHYTDDGIFGTVLLWRSFAMQHSERAIHDMIRVLMADFAAPMGVPGEYTVEYYVPEDDEYAVISTAVDEDEAGEPSFRTEYPG
jgi:hypothetical protein